MKSLKIQICQNNKRPSFHLRKNQSLRIRRDERLHAVAHFFQRKICKNLNLCRLSILWQNKHWLENKYLQLDLSILLPCRWSWIGRELDVWVQCKAEVGHPCCALQPIPEQELVIHLWLCTLCSLKYNARLDYTLWLALLSLHALQTSKCTRRHISSVDSVGWSSTVQWLDKQKSLPVYTQLSWGQNLKDITICN